MLNKHFELVFPEKEIKLQEYNRKFFSTRVNHRYLRRLVASVSDPNPPIDSEYSQDTMRAAYLNEIQCQKALRAIIHKEKRIKIKDKVEKIINKIDQNRHNIFKVLGETKDSSITCLINRDTVTTDLTQIENKL